MDKATPIPATDGDVYIPYEDRTGDESTVWFTRDLSAEGLRRVCARVTDRLRGHVAVKLHTGEPDGPNIIPRPWVRELVEKDLADATIVETNTYYEGARYTTEDHLATVEHNGWTFCPVDIMDAEGDALLPVEGGRWFKEMAVGASLPTYDTMLTLTHFKGHAMGGFGGSDKNLGIGCASGLVGKKWIHSGVGAGEAWGVTDEEFMERMTESTKSVVDFFGEGIVYVNVMRNMSVSCDCEGVDAAPVVTPNVGILASTDILAVDQACVDIVFAMTEEENHDLVERITSRHGLRQLSYMKELGMGNDRYRLVDVDHGDEAITAADAAADLVPFGEDDR
ncbi:DUF362 domain-containing protein [Caniella muris]|uniref:DUF362 domain-containing protein n=1 Tax=Caniella muris TaxID=2941502 RepID=UPI002040CE35|nr:DUF362 domain-containing protein [Caniella muris]